MKCKKCGKSIIEKKEFSEKERKYFISILENTSSRLKDFAFGYKFNEKNQNSTKISLNDIINDLKKITNQL
jgi:hypothetical protein